MRSDYNKPAALEHIFNRKYDSDNPQPEIPFTRDEVRDAITATGGKVPSNLNNFVKDLTRSGNSDARSPSATQAGYFLREGTHSGSMGIFFRDSGPFAGVISIACPSDLVAKPIRIEIPSDILDLLRPDEGGLLAAIEYGGVLDDFFGVPKGTITRVQAPVKVQPHELDCFFIMKEGNRRIPIPCEAKSKGQRCAHSKSDRGDSCCNFATTYGRRYGFYNSIRSETRRQWGYIPCRISQVRLKRCIAAKLKTRSLFGCEESSIYIGSQAPEVVANCSIAKEQPLHVNALASL